jgi:hypothetical protein
MWHNFLKQLTGAATGSSGASGAPPSSSYWTVHSSHACGVGAGAGNNFSSTFTASEWLRAGAGSTHAWFVLQSPASPGITDGPYYLLVSLGTASDQNAIVAIAKGAFSGGTTTADPTASNQSTYTTTQVHPNTTTAGKTHFVTDAAGNFFFFASKNGSGYMHTMLLGQTLTEARSSGDSGRFVIGLTYTDSARGTPPTNSTVPLRGWQYDGTTAMDASTNLNNVIYLASNSSSALVSVITQLNAIDSKVDGIPAAYVVSIRATYQAIRGRLPDVWFCGAGPAVGAGDPSGAAPSRIVLGGMIFPMEVAPGL